MNMRRNPQLSILIPWFNRDEICTSLKKNKRWFDNSSTEVLLINCGGDSRVLADLSRDSGIPNLRHINIPTDKFNKSLALNLGAYCSRASCLSVLDADIILTTDVLTQSLSALDKGSFVTIARVGESRLTPDLELLVSQMSQCITAESFISSVSRVYCTEIVFRDGTSTTIPTFRQNLLDGSRAGCGLITLKKEHLAAIGGYNSQLEYWGWEDNDIQFRLKKMLSLTHVELGEAQHISHGDDKRALHKEFGFATDKMNFRLVCARYAQGNFLGTYSDDISNWREKVIET